jgi:hypothetical protein
MAKNKPVIFYVNFDENNKLKSIIQYIENIEKHDKCLVPKWLVGLGCIGSAFITILLAASLLLFFSPKHSLYQESCEKKSCFKDLNLKCINKTCLCETGYIYIDKCILKKNYIEKCHITAVCKDETEMICLDGVCKCAPESYWNGTMCQVKSTYNQVCTKESHCLTSQFLYCDLTQKKCSCDSYYRYWDQSSCFPKRTLNDPCNVVSECRSWENTICLNSKCKILSLILKFRQQINFKEFLL